MSAGFYERIAGRPDTEELVVHFSWQGVQYSVKRHPHTGYIIYRDTAHLGGPWSLVDKTLTNTSIRLAFRNALRRAMFDLKWRETL